MDDSPQIELVNHSFLCNINIVETLNKYFKFYTNTILPEKKKIIEKATKNISPTQSKSITAKRTGVDRDTSNVYSFLGKSNTDKNIFTTNHEFFDVKREGETSINKTVYCNWCRKEVKYDESLGIPIKIIYDKLNDKLTFIVDDYYCRFECMYSGFKLNYPTRITSRFPMFMDSEQLIRFMFHTFYPGEELRESKDWRLKKSFSGGVLSDEEFYERSHFYVRLANVNISYCKGEYEEYIN